MGFHPRPLRHDFKDSDFQRKLANLVVQLGNDLDHIDISTNWSATQFIPLDAEVEVFRGDRRSSEVLDLMEGLVRNRDRQLLVVLGDPGSGKSVALRKLARVLLAEARITGRIPIYVNLKEWRADREWTPSQPPSTHDLITFIQSSLRRRLGLTTIGADLIEKGFSELLETGRIFLILDSFDEIPQLLDIKDASWLIRALSTVTTQLIAGSLDGRGIIASRLYRQPNIIRSEFCRLDIRPLSDTQSSKLIDQLPGSKVDRATVKRAIFVTQPHLATTGRNPLLLTLLIEYVQRNDGELPSNQYQLFKSHMDINVRRAITGDFKDLHVEQIWAVTERIALTMFTERHFGLDMPISTLRERLQNDPVERIADFLINAKLARETQDRSFSFVHRRFNEFFLVQWLLQDSARALARAKTIPEDGRWRDALALYVEVAPEAQAAAVAEACMNELAPLLQFQCAPSEPSYARALHCLRFLNDAFRGRTALIKRYINDLFNFVKTAIDTDDILVAKNATETISLLAPEQADTLISSALFSSGTWVQETSFRACRYMPTLSTQLLGSIQAYILSIPCLRLLRGCSRLRMLIALSDSLSQIAATLNVRVFEAVCALIVPVATLMIYPIVFVLSSLALFMVAPVLDFLGKGDVAIIGKYQRWTLDHGGVLVPLFIGGSDGRSISLFTFRIIERIIVLLSVIFLVQFGFISHAADDETSFSYSWLQRFLPLFDGHYHRANNDVLCQRRNKNASACRSKNASRA
jgi:hypothetical protein